MGDGPVTSNNPATSSYLERLKALGIKPKYVGDGRTSEGPSSSTTSPRTGETFTPAPSRSGGVTVTNNGLGNPEYGNLTTNIRRTSSYFGSNLGYRPKEGEQPLKIVKIEGGKQIGGERSEVYLTRDISKLSFVVSQSGPDDLEGTKTTINFQNPYVLRNNKVVWQMNEKVERQLEANGIRLSPVFDEKIVNVGGIPRTEQRLYGFKIHFFKPGEIQTEITKGFYARGSIPTRGAAQKRVFTYKTTGTRAQGPTAKKEDPEIHECHLTALSEKLINPHCKSGGLGEYLKYVDDKDLIEDLSQLCNHSRFDLVVDKLEKTRIESLISKVDTILDGVKREIGTTTKREDKLLLYGKIRRFALLNTNLKAKILAAGE